MLTGPGTTSMMMANPALRPDTLLDVEGAGERSAMPPNKGQPRVAAVAYNSNSSRRKQQPGRPVSGNGGNVSPKSRPEEDDSSDEEDTDSESASDSEEETIISDEIQEDHVGQKLNANSKPDDSPLSGKLQELSLDGKDAVASVPPALLGEIRKMIHEEFGFLKSIVGSPESKPDSQEDVVRLPPSPRPGLRIDTQARLSPPSSPPTQDNDRFSPASSSPRGDRTQLERSVSMGATPTSPERQILVRFAEQEKQVAAGSRAGRSSPTSKTGPKLSPIDEKWGELFDDRGHSTKRLEQVLRGLANYIIEEFMPQKSIVIPPEKMAAFYSHHRVEDERNPFIAIFRCRSKGWSGSKRWSEGLEDIYRNLGCEYYLIPKDARSRPSIPSLTPSGFAKWMAANIIAYPDTEAKRLNHVVSELPINADGPWDGITERLPKQISRHLFPDKPERKTRRLLDKVLRDFVEEYLPPKPLSGGKDSGPNTTTTRQGPPQTPRIEIVSEKRLSASSSAPTTSSSPRSAHAAKYIPDQTPLPSRSRANSSSTSSPPQHTPSPPMRLGRAYSDDPARLSIVQNYPRQQQQETIPDETTTIRLPPPPLGRSASSATTTTTAARQRRASSPVVDTYRLSVGEIARANSPVPPSPLPVGSPVDGGREREGWEYQQYVPSSRNSVVDRDRDRDRGDRATPRRVAAAAAVVQDGGVGGGNPGPTWDEYLSGRQQMGAVRGGAMFGGRGHKASV